MKKVFFPVSLIAFFSTLFQERSYDFWWHLTTGKWIFEHGKIPVVDSFSFTAAGSPWVHHAWLSSLLFYGGYCLGGLDFLIFAKACWAAFFILMLSFLFTGKKRFSGWVFLALLSCILAIRFRWTLRPHIFGFGFLSLLLLFYYKKIWKKKSGPFFGILLVLIWTQIHTSVILAFVLSWVFYLGEEKRNKRLFFTALAMSATAFLNPSGYRALLYALPLFSPSTPAAFVSEFQKPVLSELFRSFLFPAIFALITFLTDYFQNRKIHFPTFFLLISGLFLPFFAVRFLALSSIFLTVVSLVSLSLWKEPVLLAEKFPSLWQRRIGLGILASVALGLGLIGDFQERKDLRFGLGLNRELFPVEAVKYIQKHPLPSPSYQSFEWGGFLMWTLPGHKVFFDGRLRVYGSKFLNQYLDPKNRNHPEVWKEAVRKYGIQSAIVSARDPAFIYFFQSSEFKLVHVSSKKSFIWVHR